MCGTRAPGVGTSRQGGDGCRGISITDSAVVDLGTYHVEVFSLSIGANANFDCSIFLEIVNCDLVVLFQTQLLGGAKVFDRGLFGGSHIYY